MTLRAEELPIGTFDNIPEALRYTVDSLIGRGHRYVINVRGPREIEEKQAATIQVVPASYVYEGHDLGLTVHLPFDPASGTFLELVRFLDTQGSDLFEEYRFQGIPCFVINLGNDTELTQRVLLHLLQAVYEYPPETPFQCDVYDDGAMPSSLPLHGERPPLIMDQEGAVRVGKSRVTLDVIVEQYENGMTPEELVRAYDTLELADAYAAIAYYLSHRDTVLEYLEHRGREATDLRAKVEAGRPRVSREELLTRRDRVTDHAPTRN